MRLGPNVLECAEGAGSSDAHRRSSCNDEPDVHPAGTYKEAAEKFAGRLARELNGPDDRGRSLTFGALLTQTWLPAERIELCPTTWHGYRRIVHRHVLPKLRPTHRQRPAEEQTGMDRRPALAKYPLPGPSLEQDARGSCRARGRGAPPKAPQARRVTLWLTLAAVRGGRG